MARSFRTSSTADFTSTTVDKSRWRTRTRRTLTLARHDEQGAVLPRHQDLTRATLPFQFFITLDKCPWLDKKHTIFGKVRTVALVLFALSTAQLLTDVCSASRSPGRPSTTASKWGSWNASSLQTGRQSRLASSVVMLFGTHSRT